MKQYKGLLIFLLVIGCLLFSKHTHAQQPAIDNGLAYLRATQNPDGSWGGTGTSLNTILQTTATTARTLQTLGITDPALTNALNFLSGQSPDTVDDLAHQLEVLAASDADVTSLIASIKAAQQTDGGWGLDLQKVFVSDVVDTLSALHALSAANAANTDTISKALGSLLGSQNVDGGWGAAPGYPSEVFYTALTLLVLKDFQTTFGLSAFIAAASNYLMNQQNPDDSFGSPTGTAFETALALQALLRFVVDPVKTSRAVNYLVSTQAGDGSWVDDAYSTALTLRALSDSQIVDRDIDNDGDGFTENQGDCNDTNPNIFPGAPDLSVDGADQNCNGIDGPPMGNIDADGDGFTPAQEDCADTNPNIHPGAVDIPNNGIDENCDGQDGALTVQIISVDLLKSANGQKIPSTTFEAYETMHIQTTINDPNLLLGITITDSTGKVVFGQLLLFTTDTIFSTGNNAPGSYTVTVQALEKLGSPPFLFAGVVLDEEKAFFTITPETGVMGGMLEIKPQFTHVGATENVNVSLLFQNISNAALNVTIQYEIQDPIGTIINSGIIPTSLAPDTTFTRIALTNFSHPFIESGNYSIVAKVFQGDALLMDVNGTISAAPLIRIEPKKKLTPSVIPPGGDKRIRIEINLEGVEGQP